jgi:hypothetical protein
MNVQNVLPRDAIPSIDQPTFGPEYFGTADDEVLVVNGGRPRAYPIRLLSYHEIVNDVFDDRAIAITWCPICWSTAVYDRQVNDQTLTFGTSGKLADDALVMYDRETETEWQQSTGAAIAGELQGERLSMLESPLLTWETFQRQYPDGEVLQPQRGSETAEEHYDMAPYERYSERDEFGLYGMRGEGPRRTWDRTDIDAKTEVLGVEIGDDALGFPLDRITAEDGLVTATVGGRDVVVIETPESATAFVQPGFELEHRDGQLYGDGATWNPITGASDDGRQLITLPTRRIFAFAWQDAHGPESFYKSRP